MMWKLAFFKILRLFVRAMQLLSRPGFYVIVLLIAVLLLITLWLDWKLDTLPKPPPAQEMTPADVSNRP